MTDHGNLEPSDSLAKDDAVGHRLLEILEFPPAERAAAIEELCGDRPDEASKIRERYEAIQRLHGARPTGTQAGATPASGSDEPGQIGPYRILEVLGEGGMGTVYLAEQREPFRRRVALKVIKLGMDSKQVLARFELERQALAVMSHPTIAKVFDAGISESGQPYFVMEFVEGVPLTDYCNEHKLAIPERIALFQSVCQGVQHAHQKGVLHRDLKPGNILVARKGEECSVKIIDFGLARATDHQLVNHTIFTERGQLMGTPEYMSPEQAGGKAHDIDTRTDIYSLGVILYELLTGELPLSSAELREGGLLEIQRKIREEDPPKPSTKITTSIERSSTWAAKLHLSPAGLSRTLRGDLDWIVMKALSKEPERRYESATNLAADLTRYLTHEPVLAGPPSAAYRLRKFVRKRRVEVVAASVLLLGLVAFTVFATAERNRAREAEGEAKEALADVLRMSDVRRVQDIIRQADEELWPATSATVSAMEAWIRRATEVLARLPLHEAKLAELRLHGKPYTAAMRERERARHPKAASLTKLEGELATWATKEGSAARNKRTRIQAEVDALWADSYSFDDTELQWQHDVFAGVVRGMKKLRASEDGLLAEVRERLATARGLRRRSIEELDAARKWKRTLEEIANSEEYTDLQLLPQEGLLPIGMDPASKLQEFAHLLSGDPAVRDQNGKLILTERTGIVLVLLPGGRFTMGAQKTDPNGQNYDKDAESDEVGKDGKPIEVEVPAFLLSKYEMTQRQWERAEGANPSYYRPGAERYPTRHGKQAATVLHPVESVSWKDCTKMLRRLNLTLPYEAQWEFGARGGKGTPWWSGDKVSLSKVANLADAFCRDNGGPPSWLYDADLDDGFVITAPVGSLDANPFGLHDVLGNVSEWCQDGLRSHLLANWRPGRVSSMSPPDGAMVRGGAYVDPARMARSTYRVGTSLVVRREFLGVRPGREIVR